MRCSIKQRCAVAIARRRAAVTTGPDVCFCPAPGTRGAVLPLESLTSTLLPSAGSVPQVRAVRDGFCLHERLSTRGAGEDTALGNADIRGCGGDTYLGNADPRLHLLTSSH